MIVPATPPAIADSAKKLRAGGLVAFPTETVYGLGTDATNAKAVAKVFAVKARPHFDPLIVHVASAEAARKLWKATPEIADKLIARFWPGPLTLILPKTKSIPDLVTAGLPTVAVRMPDHSVALQIISAAGCPVAAPSANRFGHTSPTTAQAVEEELGPEMLVIDGGPTRVGIESTVLAFEEAGPVLLRPGGVTLEQLTAVVGPVAVRARQQASPASPGLLDRHYAPATPLYILDRPDGIDGRWEPASRKIGALLLAPWILPFPVASAQILSQRGDLVEAASKFFQALRKLDKEGLDCIVASPIPAHGLGRALMDRLSRASSGWAHMIRGQLHLLRRPVPENSGNS